MTDKSNEELVKAGEIVCLKYGEHDTEHTTLMAVVLKDFDFTTVLHDWIFANCKKTYEQNLGYAVRKTYKFDVDKFKTFLLEETGYIKKIKTHVYHLGTEDGIEIYIPTTQTLGDKK